MLDIFPPIGNGSVESEKNGILTFHIFLYLYYRIVWLAVALKENTYNQTKETLAIQLQKATAKRTAKGNWLESKTWTCKLIWLLFLFSLVLIIEKQTSQFTNHAAMKTESYQLTYQQISIFDIASNAICNSFSVRVQKIQLDMNIKI
ncbi:hypothetical protein GQX74_007296, partial [Glossina fuscipes]